MIADFFTDQRVSILEKEAQCWIDADTPFRARSRVKGHGVDCVQLVAALLIVSGYPKELLFPEKYNVEQAFHMRFSIIEDFISKNFSDQEIEEVSLEEAKAGDIVAFRFGRAINHLGTMISRGFFIHSVNPIGVQKSHVSEFSFLYEKYRIEFKKAYRLKDV